MAFEAIADVSCETMSAQRFVDYGAVWMRNAAPHQTLVLATSASGGTQRIVQAIERAKGHGALTIALTGMPKSAVTQVADRSIVVELPQKERSPGIRTYQASLLGMLLVAIQLGEMQSKYSQAEANAVRQELTALADGDCNRKRTCAAGIAGARYELSTVDGGESSRQQLAIGITYSRMAP
jgi:glucosamine--fructose-6-phosphate aminotransferase (isomerizing)